MIANYVQRGESIDYVNPTDKKIAAGSVVILSNRIGVAGCDIAPGKLGSLHVAGVFCVQKANPAIEFAIGGDVYYSEAGAADAANKGADAARMGWAVEPSPSGYADVLIQIS